MNKSSLAFIGKSNQEQFSANLTLNWSSVVYSKLTIGKRFNLTNAGAIEAVSAARGDNSHRLGYGMCHFLRVLFLAEK